LYIKENNQQCSLYSLSSLNFLLVLVLSREMIFTSDEEKKAQKIPNKQAGSFLFMLFTKNLISKK
jgi:hypothetical protein